MLFDIENKSELFGVAGGFVLGLLFVTLGLFKTLFVFACGLGGAFLVRNREAVGNLFTKKQ